VAKNPRKSVLIRGLCNFDTSAIALSCYFQKFHKFLTPFNIKTYSFFALQKSRIFDTDMQVGGNYGGRFFHPGKGVCKNRMKYGKNDKKTVFYLSA
jgi:hypothetical protein